MINNYKMGFLFVFEGPDSVGKTTISTALSNKLAENHFTNEVVTFPGNKPGTLGNLVYKLHHNKEYFNIQNIYPESLQLLHIASHIDLIQSIIKPKIKSGISIILDRYYWSTYVYGKIDNINSDQLEKMIGLELIHWQEIQPNIVFLIDRDTPFSTNIDNSNWHKLHDEYDKLYKVNKNDFLIHKIQNNKNIEDVVENIYNIVINYIEKKSLSRNITENKSKDYYTNSQFIKKLSPVVPSKVYDTYWYFASERQSIFFKRFLNQRYPWTKDKIFLKYKFTNAYRASDRVSQYLIKNVIYKGEQTPEEIFFRIILFKTFNKIETWELLLNKFGEITYKDFCFSTYDSVLENRLKSGQTIYSAAYMMTSGNNFGYTRKHSNHLKLIESMMEDKVYETIINSKSMKSIFELLSSYPTIGDFLAYQYAIDINYSILTNFSESEFVMPGPGAIDGIRKCFVNTGGLNDIDIIKLIADRQEFEFERLGLNFKNLFGRNLQLIDCQNLFCEVDKYSRIAHPDILGKSGRKKIKQKFSVNTKEINFWFPPKWNINEKIKQFLVDNK